MKRSLFILLALFVALSPFALGQGFQDILGPHNVSGHGCASCHAPHSGAMGNGGTNAGTGVTYLWGRDFVTGTYQTFGGETMTVPSSFSESDPLFHTAACLSCHDGSVTIAGMTGQSFETVAGGFHVPTYLNTDGYSLRNDHPVDVPYNCGGYNWACTIDATGAVTWPTDNFSSVYGHPIRLYGVAAAAGATSGSAYVECSSCHNPHSMNRVKQKISGTNQFLPSAFFVRGWYDNSGASNSPTQFCRSCHYSKSNENVGINSTTY
jgi:hypothetical protein